MNSRKEFLRKLGLATAGLALAPSLDLFAGKKNWFEISLAEWSV